MSPRAVLVPWLLPVQSATCSSSPTFHVSGHLNLAAPHIYHTFELSGQRLLNVSRQPRTACSGCGQLVLHARHTLRPQGMRRVHPSKRRPPLAGWDVMQLLSFFGVANLIDVPWADEQALEKIPLKQIWPSVYRDSRGAGDHSHLPNTGVRSSRNSRGSPLSPLLESSGTVRGRDLECAAERPASVGRHRSSTTSSSVCFG